MKVHIKRSIIAGGKHAKAGSVVDIDDAEATYLITTGAALSEKDAKAKKKPLTKEEERERAEHPTYQELEAMWLKRPGDSEKADAEHPTYEELETEMVEPKSEKAVRPEPEGKKLTATQAEKVKEQEKSKRDK